MVSVIPILVHAQKKFPKGNCTKGYSCVGGYCVPNGGGGCNCFIRPILFGCGQICGFLAGKTSANGLLSVAGINSTAISFELTEAENVLTKVYDATGRLVRTIVKSNMSESSQQIECDNKDESGKPVPAGVYVLRMTAKNYSEA